MIRKTSCFLFVFFTCLLIPLTSLKANPSDLMLKKMGTISGAIYTAGQPSSNALLSFFHAEKGLPPIKGGLRRVPEFLSRTDAEGRFVVKLLAGDYYIGVLHRKPGAVPGPPRADEKYFFVEDKNGGLGLLTIKKQEVIDLGRLSAKPSESFNSLEESFVVEGVVLDKNGRPLKGLVVLAKSQLNIPRPEFVSAPTDENGFYQLQLPPQKSFYLVARETIAGSRPLPGSHIGTYGIKSETGLATPSIFGAGSPPPGADHGGDGSRALTVSGGAGEVVGSVDIFMYTVPDPEGIRASIQGTINSPKYEKGAELAHITFAPAHYRLEESSFEELDRWVAFLNNRIEIKVELTGHTDIAGSPEYNKELSRKRVRAVADYLINKGVGSNRLIVKGCGADNPIATNDTAEGRKLNRRVEIKFIN
jgi:flagellar motor protein MotB